MDGSDSIYKGTMGDRFITSRRLKFPKHPGIIKGRLRGSLRQGNYEKREADAVLRVIREGDKVIELGGGIGFMSAHIAKSRNIKEINTFEANPHLIPYIQSVHEANEIETATVHNAILGKRKGTVPFFVRQNLLASSMDDRDGTNVLSTEEIEVRSANGVMRSLKPDVLVCDIEGAEATLIPHMNLSSLRAAVIELHPQWIGPEGVNAVFSAFMNAGLAYFAKGSTNKVVSFRRAWPLR